MTKKNKSKNDKNNNPISNKEDDFEFMLNPGESHIDENVNLTDVVAIGFYCKVISKGSLLINIDDISIFNKNLDVGDDWRYFECEIDGDINSANLKFESRDTGVIQIDKVNRLFSKPKDFENTTTNKTNENKNEDDTEIKIEYDRYNRPYVKRNIKFYLDDFNKLNGYVKAINKPKSKDYITLSDVINSLLDDFFKGKLLTNTFIKLDKEYSFDRNDLHNNNKAIATTKPILDKEDAIIITEVPNNLDEYDEDERTYCYNGDKSIHAGYYIFNDIHYYFIYDSQEETIEVKIVDPANMKYYVHDDELKEKLLNDNSFIMESLKKGIGIRQLFQTSSKPIMYRYTNIFDFSKMDCGEPIDMAFVFNYHFEL